jgi:tetratricopeptide (TPR) repeat protein
MSKHNKEEVEDTIKEAAKLRQSGRYLDSLNILISLISKKSYSANSAFYNGIGSSHLGLEQVKEAINAFNSALKLNPKDTFASNQLGNIYRQNGKLDEALKWFEYSINVDENNFASYHGANKVLNETNQIDTAIEYGKKVLKRKDALYTENFKNRFGKDYSLNSADSKNFEEFSLKTKKKRIISFSLFGNDTAYWSGAIENAIMVDHIFSGWTARFYCDKSIPKYVLEELLKRGAEVIIMPEQGGLGGTLWRFFVANDRTIDYFIVRDVDARLNSQDRVAVDEWIKSGKSFHIMRDHPVHAELIMGGLWGGKAGLLPSLVEVINKFYPVKNKKFVDQIFLAEFVWPLIRDKSLIHDEFFQYGLAAKKFSQTGKMIFPHHVGGGYKNKKYFYTYAEYIKPVVNSGNQKDLSGLMKYHNFRSLVPIADLKAVFSNIYKYNLWGTETKSGPGSTLNEAKPITIWMKKNLSKLGIRTIVDAACGDFNWMKHIIGNSDIKYRGLDIVEELIEKNNRLYGSENIKFELANICKNPLPSCDLLLVRHCLSHLCFSDINNFLKNINFVNYKYLLIDTHVLDNSFENRDISSGGFRLINLYSKPFNFKKNKVLDTIREGYNIKYPKDLLLFVKKNVPISISTVPK